MYNNAVFVNKAELKNLKTIDDWLKTNPIHIEEEVLLQVRELITKIEEKGHYYEGEADVFNLIADAYNDWKRENR
jgi:hypothetical protein